MYKPIVLFSVGMAIQLHLIAATRPPATASPSSGNTSTTPSQHSSEKYSAEQIKDMRFITHANHPLSDDHLRLIRNPFQRARSGRPDDPHLCRNHAGQWIEPSQSNADYIHKYREQKHAKYRQRKQREDQERLRVQTETGFKPLSRAYEAQKKRIEFASKGKADEVMKFRSKTDSSTWIEDKHGRTKSEWLLHDRKRRAMRLKEYKQRRKEKMKPHLPPQSDTAPKSEELTSAGRSPTFPRDIGSPSHSDDMNAFVDHLRGFL